jgi:amino acid permease
MLKVHLSRSSVYISIINTIMIFFIFVNSDVGKNIFSWMGIFKYIFLFLLFVSMILVDKFLIFKDEQKYNSENNPFLLNLKEDLKVLRGKQ